MKFTTLLLLLSLAGCASALKTNEDNLASVFDQLSANNFDQAIQLLSKAKAYEKHGRRQIYYRQNEKVYMVEESFLKHKIDELKKAFSECERLSNSLKVKDDYNYFSRNCISTSKNHRSPLKLSINALKKYTGVSLLPLFFDKNAQYVAAKKEIGMKNLLSHQESIEADRIRRDELKKLKVLSKKPEYKKCKLQSDLIDSRKMLKMWNKNINDLKSNVKRAGQMTYKMEKSMDRSLSFVNTYKLKIQDINHKLREFPNTHVSESSCKKMIPSYGKSNADQYM